MRFIYWEQWLLLAWDDGMPILVLEHGVDIDHNTDFYFGTPWRQACTTCGQNAERVFFATAWLGDETGAWFRGTKDVYSER
jgi:hypothetical protein